ncbi:hypothetical protein [Deinococcus yavapaiensis]|uniref:Uncharacterized protein n=1 Tax=Deinococcus yavapaiensis KR-236 TaxID=694435 RepID=A0A318S806_9DEIO|nr:hypothetical protein [Deinococcus yavapaiensis]PYE51161.1 hypothetical protein DES52_11593 [Deinococcus yavapaiensis KR-236]
MKRLALACSLLLCVTQAAPKTPSLPPEPNVVLRGTLAQLAAGRLDGALANFSRDFASPAWRTTLTALKGLRINSLEPYRPTFWTPLEREYKITYDVPQGTLVLKNRAFVLLAFDAGAWRVTSWDKTPPPRVTLVPNRLVPNTGAVVKGVGFAPNAALDVSLDVNGDSVPLGKTKADAAGRLSWSFRVPSRAGSVLLLGAKARVQIASGDARVGRDVDFTRTFTARELTETYVANDLTFRYPSAYRATRDDDRFTVADSKGRAVLSGLVLRRLPATDGLSLADYAAQLGNLYGDRVGSAIDGITVRPIVGGGTPSFTVRFTDGNTGVLTTCPDGSTWALWRGDAAYAALQDGVANSTVLSCP